MEESQDNQPKVLLHIRKHSFGIIQFYLVVFAGFVAAAVIALALLPSTFNLSAAQQGLVFAGVLAVGGLMLIILFIATVVYRQSELVVTETAITQVIQHSLFHRTTSRLAMSNLQDVSAQQRGIIQTLLNYGTLVIETAGEQENFSFSYCPQPNEWAKLIHKTKEEYGAMSMNQHNGFQQLPQQPIPTAPTPVPQAPHQTDYPYGVDVPPPDQQS